MMDVSDRSLQRVKLGLRLLQLCLPLPFLTFVLEEIARTGVCLAILILMVIGKIFCLSSPVGRWPLSLCLFLDFSIVLLMFRNSSVVTLALLVIPLVFLCFLYQLSNGLRYPALGDGIIKTLRCYGGSILSLGMAFLIAAAFQSFGYHVITFSVITFFGMLGGALFIYGLWCHFACLNLAVKACNETLKRRASERDVPISVA